MTKSSAILIIIVGLITAYLFFSFTLYNFWADLLIYAGINYAHWRWEKLVSLEIKQINIMKGLYENSL